MKTAVEELFEEMNRIRLEDESGNIGAIDFFRLQNEAFDKAKKMERKQIEKAIENGYAGCCGKKTTVKLKGNFWEREEKWDERKSANAIIVNSKKKP